MLKLPWPFRTVQASDRQPDKQTDAETDYTHELGGHKAAADDPPMQRPSQLNEPESGGLSGSSPRATVGASSTVMPSAAEASAAVPSVEESEACTAAAVVEAGTAMLAVMITLAAATLIVTSDLSTPAAAATLCCKLEVSK